jgi:hemolysin activation/secretion protein
LPLIPTAAALLCGTPSPALAAPPTPEFIINRTIEGTETGDRSGIQLSRTRYLLEWGRLREQIAKGRAMRRMPAMPPAGAVGAPPPGAPAGGPPKNLPKPPKNETFSLHVDNGGFSNSTGMMREGIIYVNRNLSGNKDRITMEWFRAQGVDTGALEYCLPLDKKGSSADFAYISSASNVVYGATRAKDINGHTKAAVITLRTPIVDNRDQHTEIGLQYFYGKMTTDMGKIFPAMGIGRGTVLDSQYHRWNPYISFIHYSDSSVLFHKHSFIVGRSNSLSRGHDNYLKYEFSAGYIKDYEHGQKLQVRLDGQLTNHRRLSSFERFYLGGMSRVRGYKESILHGDEGFCAGIEYYVPIEKTRHLSAFTFFDGGRVYGSALETSANSTMLSTGIGLAYHNGGLHADITLGFPLKREIANEKVSPTRLNFMVHWNF